MTIGAIILCGGKSQRMGTPKAWLPFGPERLLQRVVRRISGAVDSILVVAAPGQDLPNLPSHVRLVRDEIAGQGPLQGLASGLEALSTNIDFAFLTATDVPFLEPRWIERLAHRIDTADLAIPHHDGFYHPMAALYRRQPVHTLAKQLLAAQKLRPVFLVDQLNSHTLSATDFLDIDPTLGSLRNLNTPEQYLRALQEAGFDPPDPLPWT